MPAMVLAVRHPDQATNYIIDGEVRVVTIDLGSAFDGKPDDSETAWDFVADIADLLGGVPPTSPVFQDAINIITEAVEAFPDTVEHVEQYVRSREALPAPVGADDRLTVTLTREQVEDWAGRELTDDEVRLLDDCIPLSSIPAAIAAIVDSFPHDKEKET